MRRWGHNDGNEKLSILIKSYQFMICVDISPPTLTSYHYSPLCSISLRIFKAAANTENNSLQLSDIDSLIKTLDFH